MTIRIEDKLEVQPAKGKSKAKVVKKKSGLASSAALADTEPVIEVPKCAQRAWCIKKA